MRTAKIRLFLGLLILVAGAITAFPGAQAKGFLADESSLNADAYLFAAESQAEILEVIEAPTDTWGCAGAATASSCSVFATSTWSLPFTARTETDTDPSCLLMSFRC